jgi:hypothetical protein
MDWKPSSYNEYEEAVAKVEIPPNPGVQFPRESERVFLSGIICKDWREQLERFVCAMTKSLEKYGDIRIPVDDCPVDTDLKQALRERFAKHGYTRVFQKWGQYRVIC